LVLVAGGIFGGGWYISQYGNPLNSKQAVKLFSGETKIAVVGKNAFGSLAETNGNSFQQPLADGIEGQRETAMLNNSSAKLAPSAISQAAPSTDQKMAVGTSGGTAGSNEIGIMPPYYNPYKFVYKGEKFELSDAEGDVFKRVKNPGGSGPITDILRTISLGLLDLNKLQNLNVQSFTLVEDRDFGFMVTVNSLEGSVYMNKLVPN